MTIKNFGGRIASVWEGLRPNTRKMLVGALQTSVTSAVNQSPKSPKFSYDAHADWELSRLLFAIDEQSRSADLRKDIDAIAILVDHLLKTTNLALDTLQTALYLLLV